MNQQGVSSIGQQVARYRKAAKMSGEELAEKAGEGLTRSVIANLENGRKDDVTVTQLMALAKALHVPPALLVADVFDPGAASQYPLPEAEYAAFDSSTKELVTRHLATDNSRLIDWFGAQSFRATHPIENPATRLAEHAFSSIRAYSLTFRSFTLAAARYASALKSDDAEYRDHAEEILQREAGSVLSAVEGMQRAGVTISDRPEGEVYTILSDLGLTFDPDLSRGVAYVELLPDSDG